MSRPKILNDKEIRWANTKLSEGYTQSEVAKALYVSRSTLSLAIQIYRDTIRTPLIYKEGE